MFIIRFLLLLFCVSSIFRPTTPPALPNNYYKTYTQEMAHCSPIWGPLWAKHFAQNLYDFGNSADAMTIFNRQLFEYDKTQTSFSFSINTEHIGGNLTPESTALLLAYAEMVRRNKITPTNEILIHQKLARFITKHAETQKNQLTTQLRAIKTSLRKALNPQEKDDVGKIKTTLEKQLSGLKYAETKHFVTESLHLLNRAIRESIKGDHQIYPEYTAHKLILAHLKMSCLRNNDLIKHSLAFDRYCKLYRLPQALIGGGAKKFHTLESPEKTASFFEYSKAPPRVLLYSYFFCPLKKEKDRLNLVKVILKNPKLRTLPEAKRMVLDLYHNHGSTYEQQVSIGRSIQHLDTKLFKYGLQHNKFIKGESSHAALATLLLEQLDWKEHQGAISNSLEKLKDTNLIAALVKKINTKPAYQTAFKDSIPQAPVNGIIIKTANG